MVVGVHGANGPCAQKRVALDPSIAVGPVPIQVQHTEENSAPEKAKRRETATPVLVQVLYNTVCLYQREHVQTDYLFNILAAEITK